MKIIHYIRVNHVKNAIQYYYNLFPNDVHQTGKNYHFTIDGFQYFLVIYERSKEELTQIYELHTQLLKKGIYCHEIIQNQGRELLTTLNNIPYILLKTAVEKRKIEFQDILQFSYLTEGIMNSSILTRDNWFLMWTEKIDYFEYQISQFGKKYPLIRESIGYFIGLAENGISFIRNIGENPNPKYTVCHRRIKNDYQFFDLYNPLEFVLDNRVRDVCEYFKYRFLEVEDLSIEIIQYLQYNQLTTYECLLFFGRLFFFSPYFDIYEDIINNGKNEEELLKVISRVNEYEKVLKNIYLFLRNYISVDSIEWLMNI